MAEKVEMAVDEVEELEQRAKATYDSLVQRKTELRSERDLIDSELSRIDVKLERLEHFISPPGSDQEDEPEDGESPKRKSGVLATTREIVEKLPLRDGGWPEDDIVETVTNDDPSMKDSSVRSALRRLHKKGVLQRWGKRGDRRYAVVSEEKEESDDSRGPTPDEKAHEIIANAGEEGVSWSDVAWKLGDAEVTQVALHTLVEAGHVEQFYKDGATYYRLASGVMRAAIGGIQKGMEKSERQNAEEEEDPSPPQRRFAFPGVRPPDE